MPVARRLKFTCLGFVVAVAGPVTVAQVPAVADSVAGGASCSGALLADTVQASTVEDRNPRAFEVAADRNDVTVERLSGLAEDPGYLLDECGEALYAEPLTDPDPEEGAEQEGGEGVDEGAHILGLGGSSSPSSIPNANVPLSETFTLASKPGAPRTIFLDFDGHTVTGSAWNGYANQSSITAPPYSYDSTVSAEFSNTDLTEIQRAWQVVAEDFAPFNVNVTTKDPGAAAIDRSSSADLNYGSHVLVTGSGPVLDKCGCGGIAYVSVFNTSGESHMYYQPAWVFGRVGNSGKSVGEAASHEVGHNFGLVHDGTSGTGYYAGSAPWAPIMGVGYSQPLVQWSRGEYPDADQAQEDVSTIATGAPVRGDDHGNTVATATALGRSQSIDAIISTRSDVDAFQFTGVGSTSVTVENAPHSNLDVELRILDGSGNLVATSNPPAARVSTTTASGLNATWTATLPSGGATYTAIVDGVGTGDPSVAGKYSDYGSLGNYRVTMTTSGEPAGPVFTVASVKAPVATVGQTYTATPVTASGGTGPYAFTAAGLPAGLTMSADTGTISGTPDQTGAVTATVTVIDAKDASATVSVPVTVQAAHKITVARLPRATVGRSYASTISVTGGSGPFSFTAAGLPSGLTANPSTGRISGRPTQSGSRMVTLTATDANGDSISRRVPISVVRALRFVTSGNLPSGRKGKAYSVALAGAGGVPAYRFARTSGSIAPGLSLAQRNNRLVVVGTPRRAGTYRFVVRVRDTIGNTTAKTFRIRIYRR